MIVFITKTPFENITNTGGENARDNKPYIKTKFVIETLIYKDITNHNWNPLESRKLNFWVWLKFETILGHMQGLLQEDHKQKCFWLLVNFCSTKAIQCLSFLALEISRFCQVAHRVERALYNLLGKTLSHTFDHFTIN